MKKEKKIRRGLYAGSFNPLTNGHMDIINQALQVFDEVIVAVGQNPDKKNPMFTPEERVSMIQEVYKDAPRVKVISFEGLTVNIAKRHKCDFLIRGLRCGVTSFDDECYQQKINQRLGSIKTICFFANEVNELISSTLVRMLFNQGEDYTSYVPHHVKECMGNLKD